jgi:5-methylcytosine-specific restriction enzyme A
MSHCHLQGLVTLATQVDHVVPHRGDPRLFWDQHNWQSLCASCGARKSRQGL